MKYIDIHIADFLGQPIFHRLYTPVEPFYVGIKPKNVDIPKKKVHNYKGNKSVKTPRESRRKTMLGN